LDAAYSLRMENEVGSIVPGKLANFTVLSDNPVTVAPAKIKDIAVWGTVQEGRKLPVQHPNPTAAALRPDGTMPAAPVTEAEVRIRDSLSPALEIIGTMRPFAPLT
jgi:adenine deaminase